MNVTPISRVEVLKESIASATEELRSIETKVAEERREATRQSLIANVEASIAEQEKRVAEWPEKITAAFDALKAQVVERHANGRGMYSIDQTQKVSNAANQLASVLHAELEAKRTLSDARQRLEDLHRNGGIGGFYTPPNPPAA